MGRFGEDLAREREHRGVSLFKITETTKISSRHLEALEQDRFSELPGGVFNKGIVRGYARVVGLDEAAWVDRYLTAYAESGLAQVGDADWVNFAQNVGEHRGKDTVRQRLTDRLREGFRPDMTFRWAGVAVLLLLVVGLGWFVWHYVHERVLAATRVSSAPVVQLDGAPQSILPQDGFRLVLRVGDPV